MDPPHFPQNSACAGDVLVLTKPIGTGLALKVQNWLANDPEKRARMTLEWSHEQLNRSIRFAVHTLKCSNDYGAFKLLKKFQVNAIAEIGSRGLLGDAESLVKLQNNSVDFLIYNIPHVALMDDIAAIFDNEPGCQLLEGRCPELHGGLLIAMKRHQAGIFCQKLKQTHGVTGWIIGVVEYGTRNVTLMKESMMLLSVSVEEGKEQLVADALKSP